MFKLISFLKLRLIKVYVIVVKIFLVDYVLIFCY